MMHKAEFLKFLRGSWLIVLACGGIFALIATVAAPTPPPLYEATTTLAVAACVPREQPTLEGCDAIRGTGFAIQRSQIYSTLGTTAPVLQRVDAQVDFDFDDEALRVGTVVTSDPSSPLIDVQVLWPNAEQSVELTNAVAQSLMDYAAVAIDRIPDESGTVDFFVANAAVQSVLQSSRSVAPWIVGLVLGLTVGLVMALARYLLNPRLRSSGEAENLTNLDCLADIPARPNPLGNGEVHAEPDGPADSFRRLRAAILPRAASSRARTVLVTSSQFGESGAHVAQGLAESIGETGARVVLVILDENSAKRKQPPVLASGFMERDPGTDLHISTGPVLFHKLGDSSVHVLAIGSPLGLDPDLLDRATSETLSSFDFVVISAPPVLPTADAISLLPTTDVVLLVAGIGVVHRKDLVAALRSLTLAGATTIGIATTTPTAAAARAKAPR